MNNARERKKASKMANGTYHPPYVRQFKKQSFVTTFNKCFGHDRGWWVAVSIFNFLVKWECYKFKDKLVAVVSSVALRVSRVLKSLYIS